MEQQAFSAFISYRHQSPDAEIAKRLHTLIESYTIPGSIRAGNGKKHPGKVFRDQEELPLSADLGKDIETALDGSEWLIAICSPRYLESRWCMREVEYFIEKHGRQRVLTVLAEGEPQDSFPEMLRFNVNAAGEKTDVEPLAADVRGDTVQACLNKLKKEKLRILAPMLGVSYDSLYRRQRRRTMRRALVLSCAAAVAAGGLWAYSAVQRQRVEAQRAAAARNECDLLVEQAASALGSHEKSQALDLAAQAHALSDTINGYRSAKIRETLAAACYAGDFSVETPLKILGTLVTGDAFSPDGKKIAGLMNANTLGCCDARTGQLLWTDTYGSEITSYHWKADSSRLAVTSQWAHTTRVLDAETGEALHALHTPWALNACFIGDEVHIVFEQGILHWDPQADPNGENIPLLTVPVTQHAVSQMFHGGRFLTARSDNGTPYTFTVVDIRENLWYSYEAPYYKVINSYTVSPDGQRLFIHQWDRVYVSNLDTDEVLWSKDLEQATALPSLEHFRDPVWYGDVVLDNVAQGAIQTSFRIDAYDALTGDLRYSIPDEQCVGVAPDGKYLLCTGGVYSLADGTRLTEFPGRLLAVDDAQEHYLIQKEGISRAVAMGKGSQYPVESYAGTLYADRNEIHRIVSPDDQYTVIENTQGFTVLRLDGTNDQYTIYDFTPSWWINFTRDSRLVALGTHASAVAVYELATGKQRYLSTDWVMKAGFGGFTFNREGTWLMYANENKTWFGAASMETGSTVYEMHALKPVSDWGFDEETGDAVIVYEDGSALCANIFTTPEELYAYADALQGAQGK